MSTIPLLQTTAKLEQNLHVQVHVVISDVRSPCIVVIQQPWWISRKSLRGHGCSQRVE